MESTPRVISTLPRVGPAPAPSTSSQGPLHLNEPLLLLKERLLNGSRTVSGSPGFWLITMPAGTVLLLERVTVPTVRLALIIACSTPARGSLSTLGTVTVSGPCRSKRDYQVERRAGTNVGSADWVLADYIAGRYSVAIGGVDHIYN